MNKTLVDVLTVALAATALLAGACKNGDDDDSGSTSSSSSSSSGGTLSSSASAQGGSSSAQGVSSSGAVGSSSSTAQSGGSYTPEQLAAARAAVPKLSLLKAPAPGEAAAPPDVRPPTVGQDAFYPQVAVPIVRGINGLVGGLVNALQFVTDLAPSFYNSDTHEFVWGPYADDDSALVGDTIMLYVRERTEPGADFHYEYAVLRGMGQDGATFKMVIWGGANPDATNEEFGSGVVLWDFEANKAFLDTNDPTHGDVDHGRFVSLYMKGPDETDAQKVVTVVLATFHDFVSKDHPAAAPANFDHLYGHVLDPAASSATFDFVNIAAKTDLHNPNDGGTSQLEDLDLKLAFYNSGVGRGEATGSGGDVAWDGGTARFVGVECWDAMVKRIYFHTEGQDIPGVDGGPVPFEDEGQLDACGPFFSQTLDALNVPSLADVDPALLAALRTAAENGIPQP